jgi:tetratricopeptide (TPR) repeat protein
MCSQRGLRVSTMCVRLGALVLLCVSPALLNAAPVQAGARALPDQTVTRAPDDLAQLEAIESKISEARFQEAEVPLRQYLVGHPDSWRAHYDLGYVLFRERGGTTPLADRIKESIQELSKSLQLNLNNAEAHKILGLDLTMIQRDDLAGIEFEQAVRLDPVSAEMHYFLGRHFMALSDFDQAKTELEMAIQLDAAYMKAYDNLGITMERLGNRAEALTDYQKAIQLDEKQKVPSELPYLDLAKFYHAQNNLDNALLYVNKALALNMKSDQALFELARIYREGSKWTDAVNALQKAIAINPYVAQYYFLLGRTYRSLGELDESKRAFDNYEKYRDISEPIS